MRQTTKIFCVILSHFILLAFCQGASGQATFTPLGDLQGPVFLSLAFDISAEGSVVVGEAGSETSAFDPEAFRWTMGTGMVGLGFLPNQSASEAFATSDNGAVVVGQANSISGKEAFRWTAAAGMVALGGPPALGGRSAATDVSADGSVTVGFGTSTSGTEAFRWTAAAGKTPLGNLHGGANTDISRITTPAISADGSAVVGYTISPTEAARWTAAGGIVRLGDLVGGPVRSEATDVSADGSVVVGYGTGSNGREAFRWTSATGMIGLGDLPGGPFDSFAHGVSADGSVVVGGSISEGDIHQAFYWTETMGMVNLRDFLIANGASNLAGWTLVNAQALSANGLNIVGTGIGPRGTEAWLATIPEPSTLSLAIVLSLGVLTVAFRMFNVQDGGQDRFGAQLPDYESSGIRRLFDRVWSVQVE